MNSRSLAALLSSLISQTIILIFLIFRPSNPLTVTNSISFPHHNFREALFPLLHYLLSTSDIAAAAAVSFLSFSRKRKRVHFDGSDDPNNGSGSKLCRLDSVLSRNPESFKQFFKMKSSSFEWLCGLLEPLLDCRDPADSPLNLPAETRLGIGLFRLATGADYTEISSRFGVSEADSKFCVKQLCRVLCTNYRFWVGFPSQNELDSVSSRFETLTGLPNCCGIVSCTRFRVERGNSFDSIARQESIAAQIVVDSSSRILSVIAGFRGYKSDFHILKSSNLFKDIENGVILNLRSPINVNDVVVPQYLLGFGEYPLLSWLLIPFRNPQPGSVEENFNSRHRSMCVSSLKALASLRNWGVLNKAIETEYKTLVACIGACSILHNMLISREDYSAFCDDLDDQNVVSLGGNVGEEKALVIRKALATRVKK